MLARLIFVLLIVVIVMMVMRRLRARGATPRKRASIDAKTVRCAHCQVYLPTTDAVARGGQYYCTTAHADQARQRP
jgi:uncharacterized protein